MNRITTADDLNPTPELESSRRSWADRTARRLLLARLRNLSGGQLTLADAAGVCELGGVYEGDLRAEVRVHRPRFYRQCSGEVASRPRLIPRRRLGL